MKTSTRLVLLALVGALALPLASFAAKGEKKKDKAPAATFATADKDGDGSVSQDEYVAAVKGNGKKGDDTARSRFATLDKNNDGKLSKEEFGGPGAKGEKKKGRKKNQE